MVATHWSVERRQAVSMRFGDRLRSVCKARPRFDLRVGDDTVPSNKGRQNLHRHKKEQLQSGSPQRSQNALGGIGMLGFHIFPLLVRS